MCKGQASPSMGRGENSRGTGDTKSTSTQDPGVSPSWERKTRHYCPFYPSRAGRGSQAGCLPLRCGFPQPYLLPQKGLWNSQAPPGGMQFQPLKSPKALASFIIKVSFTVSRCHHGKASGEIGVCSLALVYVIRGSLHTTEIGLCIIWVLL